MTGPRVARMAGCHPQRFWFGPANLESDSLDEGCRPGPEVRVSRGRFCPAPCRPLEGVVKGLERVIGHSNRGTR